jgi:hypothetical protein
MGSTTSDLTHYILIMFSAALLRACIGWMSPIYTSTRKGRRCCWVRMEVCRRFKWGRSVYAIESLMADRSAAFFVCIEPALI